MAVSITTMAMAAMATKAAAGRTDILPINRTVNDFGSVHVTNVYESNVTVINNSHVSYNGAGGLTTQPTAAQRQVMQERHVPMTAVQTSHVATAAKTPELAASRNGGHPAIAATARPAAPTRLAEPAGRPAAARPAEPAPHPTVAPRPAPAAYPAEPGKRGPARTCSAPGARTSMTPGVRPCRGGMIARR